MFPLDVFALCSSFSMFSSTLGQFGIQSHVHWLGSRTRPHSYRTLSIQLKPTSHLRRQTEIYRQSAEWTRQNEALGILVTRNKTQPRTQYGCRNLWKRRSLWVPATCALSCGAPLVIETSLSNVIAELACRQIAIRSVLSHSLSNFTTTKDRNRSR